MIVFGSRGSRLALTQTKQVAEELKQLTGEDYEIQILKTRGDLNLGQPLPEIGGKGLFTAELEEALRTKQIDVAVHSLKDLPVEDPEGLEIGAIPRRANPHDVLVYHPDAHDPEAGIIPLRKESIVGTSSPRRSSSLAALRCDLRFKDIRGNVETRAEKVLRGDYHATLLAAAGLLRLQLATPGLSRRELAPELCTPAPAQGALGVQCRKNDSRVRGLLLALHDDVTSACAKTERKLLFLLGGGCSMPLGALVQPQPGGSYRMLVSLYSEDQQGRGIRLTLSGEDPDALAEEAASELRPLLGNPLAGRSLVLLRPGGEAGRLGDALALAGARVETVAATEIQPLPMPEETVRKTGLGVVAFTSPRAVDRFFEEAMALCLELKETRFYGGGPATAEAICLRGHGCRAPKGGSGGKALAETIMAELPKDQPILFPCAEDRHEDLEAALRAGGYSVEPLPVYKTLPLLDIQVPEGDYVILTSPSAVRAGGRALKDRKPGQRYLAIGQTTARAMQAAGLIPQAVSPAPTAQALVGLIVSLNHDDPTQKTAPDSGAP